MAETDKFMNGVKGLIDEETQLWLNNFKEGLSKLKTPQKGPLKLDESTVIASGDRLLSILKNRFEVNMAKFELYARRNVFCSSSANKTPSASNSVDTASLSSSSNSNSIEEMRKTHAKLLQTQFELAAEYKEAESLRDNMRAILITLRSAFAELQLGQGKSLEDVVGLQIEQLRKLHDLSSRANDLTNAIIVGMGVDGEAPLAGAGAGAELGSDLMVGGVSTSSSSSSSSYGIATGTTEELNFLSNNLKSRRS